MNYSSESLYCEADRRTERLIQEVQPLQLKEFARNIYSTAYDSVTINGLEPCDFIELPTGKPLEPLIDSAKIIASSFIEEKGRNIADIISPLELMRRRYKTCSRLDTSNLIHLWYNPGIQTLSESQKVTVISSRLGSNATRLVISHHHGHFVT